jgi:hypothetical protein
VEFNRIKLVGVELEGGWTDRPPSPMIGDGSIRLVRGNQAADGRVINHVGEIPSPPFASPAELFAWMRDNYPQHTDRSCGMHVHLSFKSNNSYVRIMDKAFFDHVRAALIDWGRGPGGITYDQFFSRLEGGNSYCRTEYRPMEQVKHKEKGPARYSILNYCYGRYQTVELRALPLFPTLVEAEAAITAYFEIVENWLARPPRGLKPVRKFVDLERAPYEKPQTETIDVTVRDDAETREVALAIRDDESIREIAV